MCAANMACPLYSEMSLLTIGVGILSCASWKHRDSNVTRNFSDLLILLVLMVYTLEGMVLSLCKD